MTLFIFFMTDLIMGYFDDIQFIHGEVIPGCRARLDRRFTGTYSFEFLLTGRMIYAIDDGPDVLLATPSAFWHHPRHRYRYGAVDDNGWHHHWLMMKGPRARRFVEEGLMAAWPGGSVPVHRPHEFAELFRALLRLTHTGDRHHQGEAVLLLERMLRMLQRDHECGPTTPACDRIGQLANTIRQQPIDYDWPTEARRLHLSYSHFRRRFKAQTGMPPQAYCLLWRMRKAAELLRAPDAQVQTVALRMGYDDPAPFSRLFKQKLGLSPRAYQLLCASDQGTSV